MLLNEGQQAAPPPPPVPTPAPPIAPTGSLTAAPEPSAFESAFTLTAAFTGSPSPTGAVTFSIAGTQAGTGTLAAGTASLALNAPYPAYLNGKPLLPGTYPLSASYAGDTKYTAATLTGSHTVLLGPTSVALIPTTPLQTYYGQPIDGTFSISVVDGNYGTTGTYTLLDNGQAVGICTRLPVTLAGKPVTCPYGNPVFLDAGTHAFSVVYNGGPANGDPINDSSASAPTIYTALPDITRAVSLTSSLNPSIVGQAVTFTATFASNVATPVGPVRFLDGTVTLGTGILNAAGIATVTTSALAVGTHSITAVYDATLDFQAVASTPLSQVVNPAVDATFAGVLTSSLNPSTVGQAVTFTAVFSSNAGTPTGGVRFVDGTMTFGTATLNTAGVATLTTSALAVGTHPITAVYDATQQFLASTSAPLSQVVNPLGTTPPPVAPAAFTLTVSPNPVTIGFGKTAMLVATVTGPLPVTLSCKDTFTQSACMFLQTTFPAGGGSSELLVATAAPHDCGDPEHPYYRSTNRPLPGPSTLLGTFAGAILLFRKRRRLSGLLALLVAALALSTISGCGRCTDLGTQPGNYSFSVIATAGDGTTKQLTIPVHVVIP